ncbi:MAG: PspC domain-containing protein [Anaeromyxobacteraceae bacterium]|nr:PspC domain-containing protein [Anaeromyxobacteraceae bacterium]
MLCPYCRTENRPGSTRCASCTSWMVERRPVQEWTRAREGAMVGGVARGLATRFGAPVAAVRIGFVLATIFGLWGLAIYVALWVILPLEPPALPASSRPVPPEQAPGAT